MLICLGVSTVVAAPPQEDLTEWSGPPVVEWEFLGVFPFADPMESPIDDPGVRWFIQPDESASPQDPDILRIDADGSHWRLASIDPDALAAFETHYDARFRNQARHEDYVGEPIGLDPGEIIPPGELVLWEPQSWSHLQCDGDNKIDSRVWNSDGRSVLNSHTQQEGAVARVNILSTGGRCSGVFVESDVVLTAAHCVVHGFFSTPYEPEDVQLCNDEFGGCALAEVFYVPAGFQEFGSDFSDDWALIHVTVPLSLNWMALSDHADGTLSALTKVFHVGRPRFAPNCTSLGLATTVRANEVEPIASIQTKRVSFKLDNGPGHSGGPIYFCPTGDDNVCLSGEVPYLYALYAGYNQVSDRAVGPKIPYWRSSMLGILESM